MNKLGATGDHPRGKLNQEDEGAIQLAIGTDGDVVKIIFGSPVAWLGLPKREAVAFAQSIMTHAMSLPDDHPTKQ